MSGIYDYLYVCLNLGYYYYIICCVGRDFTVQPQTTVLSLAQKKK